jgi:hypothetical protein
MHKFIYTYSLEPKYDTDSLRCEAGKLASKLFGRQGSRWESWLDGQTLVFGFASSEDQKTFTWEWELPLFKQEWASRRAQIGAHLRKVRAQLRKAR